MPKKLNASELLKELKKAKDDDLRPVSTRVTGRCLRALLQRCAREKLDLAIVVRELIEEHAGEEKRDTRTLPPDAQKWLDVAVARVREAYRKGISPIDAILTQPLCRDL